MFPRTISLYVLCTFFAASFIFTATARFASAGAEGGARGINYIPLAPIDVSNSEFALDKGCVAPDCFPNYLRTIYNVGVGLAGLFAVVSIVRGGFQLLWTDSILNRSEAKGIILRALGGLVIVYSSYIFMNQISPSLGRDLDLSLDAAGLKKRLTVQKATGGLIAVDDNTAVSEYQLKLYEEAKLRNKAWRDAEDARIKEEIDALITKLNAETDEEERLALQMLINEKTKERALLQREGVIVVASRDASLTFQPAASEELLAKQMDALIGSGDGIDKIHSAYDKYIADARLTPLETASVRKQEAVRMASIQEALITGILEHPPKTFSPYNTAGMPDDAARTTLISARIADIETERTRAIQKIDTLIASGGVSAGDRRKIEEQKEIITNITCSRITNITQKCKEKKATCPVPATLKTSCTQ